MTAGGKRLCARQRAPSEARRRGVRADLYRAFRGSTVRWILCRRAATICPIETGVCGNSVMAADVPGVLGRASRTAHRDTSCTSRECLPMPHPQVRRSQRPFEQHRRLRSACAGGCSPDSPACLDAAGTCRKRVHHLASIVLIMPTFAEGKPGGENRRNQPELVAPLGSTWGKLVTTPVWLKRGPVRRAAYRAAEGLRQRTVEGLHVGRERTNGGSAFWNRSNRSLKDIADQITEPWVRRSANSTAGAQYG